MKNLINHDFFMARAIQIARLGFGNVAPNPLVGSVIVHNNQIIGEGFHQKYGSFHAEVNAIDSVFDKTLLSQSTIYVTLEPCAHYGKTPPCALKILNSGIKKVVVAQLDPNPKVAGKGIEILKNNQIEVIVGVLEKEARDLNKHFLTFFEQKRPFVTLKWAQTKDKFVARSDYSSKWITNTISRTIAHQLRANYQAILVGYNTIKFDNPNLDTRLWHGNNPKIFVIDLKNELSRGHIVFQNNATRFSFFSGVNHIVLDQNKSIEKQILDYLYKQNIQSLMIEGGSKTIQAFINQNIWDEAWVFENKQIFESGIKAPNLNGTIIETQNLDNDIFRKFMNHSN